MRVSKNDDPPSLSLLREPGLVHVRKGFLSEGKLSMKKCEFENLNDVSGSEGVKTNEGDLLHELDAKLVSEAKDPAGLEHAE